MKLPKIGHWGPVFVREMKAYFNSPIAYITTIFFLTFTAVWFFQIQHFIARNQATLRPLFGLFPVVFILLIPALTMRIWAEEKKLKTDELLLTLPFHEADLVVGKFLASFFLLALMIFLTLPIPMMVGRLGSFDGGQTTAQYFGSLLLGGAGLALGIFLSSVSRNQISAFIFTVLVLVIMTLSSDLARALSLQGPLGDFLNFISLSRRFEGFSKGLIDSRDLFFYLLFTAFFLYLNYKQLIFRKWK